jgi:dTDP-4-dehydrorhamnose reductase
MKTLIIGAKGMLGHELTKVFLPFKPFLWDVEEIDITNNEMVDEKISSLEPELIINSAAYTNVDGCETNEDIALKVNGLALGYLANVALKIGATLVHYSTDYVFDGEKSAGYLEDDTPNPVNAYGRTKLVGEKEILSVANASEQEQKLQYYIIRTAWLYGLYGKNFVETMISLAEKGGQIKVVDDQIGSPTYVADLAKATLDLSKSNNPYGIYHRTGSGEISWYGFAKEIFKVLGKDANLSPCKTQEYPTPAKRPKYSVLKSTKLPEMRNWSSALEDYLKERTQS